MKIGPQAAKWMAKKAKAGFQGYPVGAVASYGPDNRPGMPALPLLGRPGPVGRNVGLTTPGGFSRFHSGFPVVEALSDLRFAWPSTLRRST
jgi:hypothetical protein